MTATVTITVDDAQVRALFGRLMEFGENAVVDAGRDIGEYMLRATRARADREAAPDGVPWVPLSPKYAKRKARKRPGAGMLHFDNFMLGSRLAYQTGPDFVDIGTSAKYGATQQFGRGSIPARPWLGASDDDVHELVQILQDHLEAAVSGS
ncbi:MAG TPA: phage virion morphogenesis protein [Rudaea sp.]|nr:phage virion morphogenesis protein [Rudaea sp.]